jgi:GAF domain-containing protein
MTDYPGLLRALDALTQGVPHPVANLANASALLRQRLEGLNWAGFYLLEGETLVLGPFQGKPACIEIPLGKGVCGTAAERREAVLVPDVHAFPGHIACDEASRSEIVVPILRGGRVFGVLDLDSPYEGRFTEEDRAGLASFVRVLEKNLFGGEAGV